MKEVIYVSLIYVKINPYEVWNIQSLNFGLFKYVLFFNEEISNIKLIKKS